MYKKTALIFILLLIPLTINATSIGNTNIEPSLLSQPEPSIDTQESDSMINDIKINGELNIEEEILNNGGFAEEIFYDKISRERKRYSCPL